MLSDEPLTTSKGRVFSLFAFFFAILVLGTQLKAKAWRMAARDDVNVNDY